MGLCIPINEGKSAVEGASTMLSFQPVPHVIPSNGDVAEIEALNQVTHRIIGAAMKVHSALGPGLLESAYEACLAYELARTGLAVERQRRQPVVYEGLRLDEGYRIDLLIDDLIIVELKAVDRLCDVHEAQLLSYLRLANRKLGLLINFHVAHLRDGIRRVINTRH